jgi:predicted nuclease of predicted toxin-antitoxin system
MRFKVDENLHPDAADLLCSAGHDAVTVYDQGLRGHNDEDIAAVCQREQRAIVTLDQDFSNIRRYPPEDYPGIMVLRLANKSRQPVLSAVTRLIPLLATEKLTGCLWIVEEHRVRIREGGTSGSP